MSDPRPVIRIYRYLAAKWALKALETGELRVSRMAELKILSSSGLRCRS
jgi:hypothetical protein